MDRLYTAPNSLYMRREERVIRTLVLKVNIAQPSSLAGVAAMVVKVRACLQRSVKCAVNETRRRHNKVGRDLFSRGRER
ncbi:hypothetical protein E2C01_059165 [Portunus trituberculatus]|uniref:Uncharacterized protein n=1 Tax=Portunus trituberculatus TaxID=210409 RepID=A0A5B7GXC3_PORTR|nr:hypothetical protein [Portunus trituberculatus]